MLKIFINNVTQLDLYPNETVEIKKAISEYENSKSLSYSDFSKSFDIPATSVNKKALGYFESPNIYNNNLVLNNGVPARIEYESDFILEGILTIINCVTSGGVAIRYTVMIASNSSLSALLKDSKINDIDFGDIRWDVANAGALLKGSGDICASLVLREKYLMYKANEPNSYNIPSQSILIKHLRPCLSVKRMLKDIIESIGLTLGYSSSVDTTLNKLYMQVDSEVVPSASPSPHALIKRGSTATDTDTIVTGATLNNGKLKIEIGAGKIQNVLVSISMDGTYSATNRPTVVMYVNGVESVSRQFKWDLSQAPGIGAIYVAELSQTFNTTGVYEITIKIISSESISTLSKPDTFVELIGTTSSGNNILTRTLLTAETIPLFFSISKTLPKISQVEFIQSIMVATRAFFLDSGNKRLILTTLDDFYSAGGTLDISRMLSADNIVISPPDLINELDLKFKSPDMIFQKTQQETTGIPKGDINLILKNSFGNVINGEKVEKDLVFEFPEVRKIGGKIVYIYNSQNLTGTGAPTTNAFLFYNYLTNISPDGIKISDTAETTTQTLTSINLPTFVNNLGEAFSWNLEYNEQTDTTPTSSLFTKFYQNNIQLINNVNRRNYEFTLRDVGAGTMKKLDINTTLKNNNDYYRITELTKDYTNKKVKIKCYNLN